MNNFNTTINAPLRNSLNLDKIDLKEKTPTINEKIVNLENKEDIISQIKSNTYKNKKVLGLEIDYVNNTFKRLQGAKSLNSGSDFNNFNMYGGRKRCIVDFTGHIKKFITSKDAVKNEMVMVYQPAFYYLRVPIITTKTDAGIRIDKEHIYVADKQYPGFKLHPAFYDKNGNEVKYILRAAFESCAYRTKNNTVELEDNQNIDLINDKLISTISAIPISGLKQNFSIDRARAMAKNNGEGWNISTLENVSVDQILMVIEYGTINIQKGFNLGCVQVDSAKGYNNASVTGSTLSLQNESGQAAFTTNKQDKIRVYTEQGKCAISYRGVENPYGNMWQFINGLTVTKGELKYNDKIINFKIPTNEDWIQAFGYDEDFDWVFLPISANFVNSSLLTIGDYMYAKNDDKTYNCVVGGCARAKTYGGLFCYGFEAAQHSGNYSARIMHTPTANSPVEKDNYQMWLKENNI